jgi:hypothetical protein
MTLKRWRLDIFHLNGAIFETSATQDVIDRFSRYVIGNVLAVQGSKSIPYRG